MTGFELWISFAGGERSTNQGDQIGRFFALWATF